MIVCPECVDCTKHYGYDVVFTMACFLNGHKQLILEDPWEDDDDELGEA